MKGLGKAAAVVIAVFVVYSIFGDSKEDSGGYVPPNAGQNTQTDYSVPDYSVPSNPVPNNSFSNPELMLDDFGGSGGYVEPEPIPELCGVCHGLATCNICDGTGVYRFLGQRNTCTACNGTKKCWKCNGTGYR